MLNKKEKTFFFHHFEWLSYKLYLNSFQFPSVLFFCSTYSLDDDQGVDDDDDTFYARRNSYSQMEGENNVKNFGYSYLLDIVSVGFARFLHSFTIPSTSCCYYCKLSSSSCLNMWTKSTNLHTLFFLKNEVSGCIKPHKS